MIAKPVCQLLVIYMERVQALCDTKKAKEENE